ncbi:MAG: hypothetical protein JWO53_1195, partial [Chlamydiia bacterium]|nr:hypothetical protein [Chlamydiia bacterium]
MSVPSFSPDYKSLWNEIKLTETKPIGLKEQEFILLVKSDKKLSALAQEILQLKVQLGEPLAGSKKIKQQKELGEMVAQFVKELESTRQSAKIIYPSQTSPQQRIILLIEALKSVQLPYLVNDTALSDEIQKVFCGYTKLAITQDVAKGNYKALSINLTTATSLAEKISKTIEQISVDETDPKAIQKNILLSDCLQELQLMIASSTGRLLECMQEKKNNLGTLEFLYDI